MKNILYIVLNIIFSYIWITSILATVELSIFGKIFFIFAGCFTFVVTLHYIIKNGIAISDFEYKKIINLESKYGGVSLIQLLLMLSLLLII